MSVLFIDKSNTNGEVLLMDASKLGEKIKVGKNQKTVLSKDELGRIIDVFINHKVEDDFSISLSYEQIKEKNYSFSAGQYFDVKIEFVELTPEEFEEKMNLYKANLSALFTEGKTLEDEIKIQLEDIKYGIKEYALKDLLVIKTVKIIRVYLKVKHQYMELVGL